MEKPEKRSLRWGPRRDWENNIKGDFKEMRNNGVDWPYLASDWIKFCDFGATAINSRVI